MAALIRKQCVQSIIKISTINQQLTRHAASSSLGKKLKKGPAMAAPQRKFLDVEEDVEKLVKTCVGANIYKDGNDPEIKPDSEYPDWLWTLRTDREPVPLEEMDPDQWEYWERLQKNYRRRKNQLQAVRIKYKDYGKEKKFIE